MTQYEVIDKIIIYWNDLGQNTRQGIIVVLVLVTLLILALIMRSNKKRRAYQGWTPPKSTRKKDGIIAVHFDKENGYVEQDSGYYRTRNKEYDKRVDFYSTPGTYEKTERRKKK